MRQKDKFSEETEKLVLSYHIELIEPPCIPGADKWSAKAHLQDNISEAFPYLNAKLEGADYDQKANVLIWESEGKKYAFRPLEIAAAPVEDREEGHKLIRHLVDIVNNIWKKRHEISPDFTQRKLPNVMEIYTLLPKTNCKECGYVTCMAYAADLRKGKITTSKCPYLKEEEKDKLSKLLDNLG
jgi:ArsR family metal-binding transcriptional regulator